MEPSNIALSPAGASESPRRRWRRQALGYLFALGCLVWVFHDFRPTHLRTQLSGIRWAWVWLAIVADVLSYLCQGIRWRLLLRPVGRISVLKATQAIYVGLFTNELLPMRIGELIRSYLVSRWLHAKFVAVLPTLIVERFFDGVWLAVGIGLTAMFVPLPRNLLEAGDVLGVVVLAGTGLFLYFILFSNEPSKPPEAAAKGGLAHGIKSILRHLAIALRTLGRTPQFYAALAVSLLVLSLQAIAYWLVMWGYGIRLSVWGGFALLLILHLGTAIPNAPANVGSYQLFSVLGLSLFGVDKTTAAGFSIVVFVILTVPLWVIGGFALSQTGATLSDLQRQVAQLHQSNESDTPVPGIVTGV